MKKNKQFAVIGLGRFGSSVARTLHNLGFEVLAIDSNEEVVSVFSNEVTHVVQADTTDDGTLKALGIRNFDAVVVAIGEDIQANVLTTLLLKEIGVKYVVTKARNELHGKMLEKIGADRIIYPERDMGQRIAHNLISTNILDYVELSPNLSLVEIAAPACLAGSTLAESNLRARYEVNVVAIKRGDELIVAPNPNEKIMARDVLIAVGSNSGVKGFEELE
jgi:trk system potassium uptake protein TrkA